MPKGKLSSIHRQDISLAKACLTSSHSIPRYIHHNMAPANANGRMTLLAEEKVLILNVQCFCCNFDTTSLTYFRTDLHKFICKITRLIVTLQHKITKISARMRSVKPKKFLGQHFLTDLSIAKDIADTVDACPDIPVLEVGPGMGVMTQFLVQKPRLVKVVEIDFESVAYLRQHFPSLEENIIEDDFLKMHLDRTFQGGPFVLTGNYPYNISSQIFFKMLDNKELIPCCTGMIQREVAQRMAAGPGSKTYGILSVLIQAWYNVEYLFTVDEHVFNPPPKVKSAVIRMTRNEVMDLGCDERLFKRLVKTVFSQRRKMLRVSLKQMLPSDSSLFTLHSSLLTKRPEQLSIQQFVELTNLVAAALPPSAEK